jgi:hypothetical protein
VQSGIGREGIPDGIPCPSVPPELSGLIGRVTNSNLKVMILGGILRESGKGGHIGIPEYDDIHPRLRSDL